MRLISLAPFAVAVLAFVGCSDNAAADGLCTLREALIAANTDLPSGTDSESPGGRPAGGGAALVPDDQRYPVHV